jgi:hypothetical protein
MVVRGNVGLSVSGDRDAGDSVRDANVTAVAALANILKSSLGPQGLDKMLVDDLGDVTITNDGATILKQLEVEHPAAQVLVELSDLQDQEVGDGTTSVVIIAAELLKRANDLVKCHIHPTSVISGYRLAMKESVKFIQQNLAVKVDSLGADTLTQVARTSLASKLIGAEQDFFLSNGCRRDAVCQDSGQRWQSKVPGWPGECCKVSWQGRQGIAVACKWLLHADRASCSRHAHKSGPSENCLDRFQLAEI